MPFTSVLRAVLALAAAAVLAATMLAVSPSASAKPAPADSSEPTAQQRTSDRAANCNWRARQCWGAMSFNKRTGVSGFANDRRGRLAAASDALKDCKRDPQNEGFKSACVKPGAKNTWVRNGCIAIAFQTRNQRIVEWAKGIAFNEDPAQREAKAALRGPGTNRISGWLCTTRRG